MAAYLREQRAGMNIAGEWHGQLGRIIAKDYAVLARVQRTPVDDGEMLWDYFFAGIRGLGTWGAAWFVDREYRQLQRFEEDEDIELLLEVTLRDSRIFSVRDVSSEPRRYFRENQNKRETILDEIRVYRE